MGIRVVKNTVPQALKEVQKRVEQTIVRNLHYVGETVLNLAKLQGDYTDRTGNLRSSVGYIVAMNKDIEEVGGFNTNNTSGTDGELGTRDGYDYALTIVDDITSKYALVIVAGMNYATYLEKREYDVLTFTELEAVKLAKELLTNLKP